MKLEAGALQISSCLPYEIVDTSISSNMSGRSKKQRSATNVAELATLTLNERILKECHQMYTDPENGLIKIAASINVKLLPPRKKITVLLIGNHSAGKSTFINWYIEEHILKTGVAIETQGFTFITSGRKRESLTGNATLHLYPHFKPLSEIRVFVLSLEVTCCMEGQDAEREQSILGLLASVFNGELPREGLFYLHANSCCEMFPGSESLVDYLTTEISTSKQKKFSLVTFIDTPGLVDGDMNYPFEVEKAILFLGDMADLIFVFFDPIGQALCKRTLNLVEGLNAKHSDRIKMYLSKADEAGHEADRQKVLMQIVQELCKRPGLNKAGFDLPTIYIPNPNKPARCMNQIEEVCKDIEKTINRTVQNTLNTLEADCNHIENVISSLVRRDDMQRRENLQASGKSIAMFLMGLFLPLLLLISVLASDGADSSLLKGILGRNGTEALVFYLTPVHVIWQTLPSDYHTIVISVLMGASIFLLYMARWFSRLNPTLSKKQKRSLLDKSEYVRNVVKPKKHQLYQEYLRQSVAEHDM